MKTLTKLLLFLVLSASSGIAFAMTAQDPTIVRGPVQSSPNAPIIERIWFAHMGKNGSTQTMDAQGNIVEEGATYDVYIWVDARLPNGELPKMGEVTVKRSGLLPQDPSSKNFVSRLSVADFQFPYAESATLTAVYDGYETTVSYSVVIQAPDSVTVKSPASSAATVKNGTTCEPYKCADGTRVGRCSADGTVINYFAAPCHDHGGEVNEIPPSFNDVPEYHVNADAISFVKSRGIVSGYSDGTYRPDQTVNRAELLKILVLGIQTPNPDFQCTFKKHFPDVDENAWYGEYLCLALWYPEEWVAGYPDGTFRPAATINFVEAAKILDKALNFTGTEGASWYEEYVRELADRNAIPLSITRFDQRITRGEMAEMIYRLRANIQSEPSRTYEELN